MTTSPAGDRRAATVSDVAVRAGVSRKTVYRALNNEGNVRPDKVERVRRVAAELGFRPNQFARLLRTRGTASMVGVVTASVGDPFWTGVLQGVEATIGGGDRFILSASTRDRSDREPEIVAAMVERRVMALLVVPTAVDQSYLGDDRRRRARPSYASTGPPSAPTSTPSSPTTSAVCVRGMELLARTAATAASPSWAPVRSTRRRSVSRATARHSAAPGSTTTTPWCTRRITDSTTVDPAVDALLALADPPTAVFTANVSTSVGLLAGLRQRQWSPAIVAFSDFDAARIHDPTVTVVDNDPVELGRRGAELALERLDGYDGPSRARLHRHADHRAREPPGGTS